jgi:hypothetical protein
MKLMIRILFLAANPKDTAQLNLTREVNRIDEELLKGRMRDEFQLQQRNAVSVSELQELLLRFNPEVVHFSGHGSEESALVFEKDGEPEIAPPEALTDLFRIINSDRQIVQCVIMNACYSDRQAEAIAKHVPCVIGMSNAISDEAAIKFAASFYRALAYGQSINNAFELGCNDIALDKIPGELTPKLRYSPGVNPAKVYLTKISDSDRSDLVYAAKKPRDQPSRLTDSMLESLKKQLEIHSRNLDNYRLELAKYGGRDIPVRLTWDIDYTEKQISLIEKRMEEISTNKRDERHSGEYE